MDRAGREEEPVSVHRPFLRAPFKMLRRMIDRDFDTATRLTRDRLILLSISRTAYARTIVFLCIVALNRGTIVYFRVVDRGRVSCFELFVKEM